MSAITIAPRQSPVLPINGDKLVVIRESGENYFL